MWYYIPVAFAFLKVLASFLVNLSAGITLLLFTIRDPYVLILDILFGILSLGIAVSIEILLRSYD